MKLKRNFLFFYFVILFIAMMFILLVFLSSLSFNFFFINRLFGEQNLSVVSKVVYMEGNRISFSVNNGKMGHVKYSTQIQRGMTIQTESNSYLSFYIKNQGYYMLFPNSTLYLGKIENYMPSELTKKSEFILEKGILCASVNFLSNNSFLILRTSNMYSKINSGIIKVDKRDDFQTKIECYEGYLYFRANSSKFDLFREKKTYIITGSIARLLDNSNILKSDYYCIIKYGMQQRLDNLLNKIYESKNLSTINKEYIKKTTSIPIFKMKGGMDDKLKLILTYNDKNSQEKTGQVGITITRSKSKVYFEDKQLLNKKYMFTLPSGKYIVVQKYDFTNIFYYFDSGKYRYQNIITKNYLGVKGVKIDGIDAFYTISKNSINLLPNITDNSVLIDIDTNGISKINDISIGTDLSVTKLYILSKNVIYNSSMKKISEKYYINNEYYFLYLYLGNVSNDKIKIALSGIFGKLESLKIICKFEKIYRFYY